MDELFFRTSQRFEALQVQLSVAAQQSKSAFQYYSEVGRDFAVQALNSPNGVRIKESARELWFFFIQCINNLEQQTITLLTTPREVYYNVRRTIAGEWTRQNIYFGCCGFLIGALIGFCIGLSTNKQRPSIPFIKAVVCNKFRDVDGICYIDDAHMPSLHYHDEVLVQVKAATIQLIDLEIANGYGKNIRKCLNRYCHTVKGDFPIMLGRECAGIITEIGPKVTRFEIGDEVWLTAPFWSPGTISEYIISKEKYISKKPKKLGFEGAASIPYSGTIAINSLKEAGLDEHNTQGKRIFIHGSCTPVGCILTQILRFWGAHLTTTSNTRAHAVALAMGSTDNISLSEIENLNSAENHINAKHLQDLELSADKKVDIMSIQLLKELKLRDNFDIIFITEYSALNAYDLKNFLKTSNGVIIDTLHKKLVSDSFGFFLSSIFAMWIYSKCLLQKMFTGHISNFGEPNMNYKTLEKLTNLVENGHLQSVVDHIYPPQEIELALLHRQSFDAIGSTVIKFK